MTEKGWIDEINESEQQLSIILAPDEQGEDLAMIYSVIVTDESMLQTIEGEEITFDELQVNNFVEYTVRKIDTQLYELIDLVLLEEQYLKGVR
ncbi:hypothetical protein AJ85_07425 [Alkalihalobacillus alcalophilus ATCC 27647 = CGMCC 1.3604]|uniref:Uncharacterized protein n=1 Tax=Alkalihalobacillus alcalophilus ATCC 27647 = CGMCC 1.3604 TaxID=1218173 RepID=A0A094WIP7_ALKAL|nr:hypothetical protein [Alkalihalobacillus alcalophilus]KGA95798.1 hypothetical protein BALCAV_0220175 [Alkalihalobacillus alcalophilus ATCC 27647 = CGMCC 1.3604]MED1563194.1 hypothetical protein [Alkalihalobacillus alcalophilus]THG91065.1 hypothetical protein AJ85_07425 [Alkalihalobacillus alcalophilus ATCC 27647 = CGMCC 1.3604]